MEQYEQLIKKVKGFKKIIVTGPQRSGTRFSSNCISYDLDIRIVDETEFNFDSFYNISLFLLSDVKMVIHAPAISGMIHYIDTPDTITVWMKRDIDDINIYEQRVNWSPDIELQKYFCKKGNIAEIKNSYWDGFQKSLMKIPYVDLEYESLDNHILWVKKQDRLSFKLNQISKH